MVKIIYLIILSSISFFALTLPGDGNQGWTYYTQLNESIHLGSKEILRKYHPKINMWDDKFLNNISHLRNNNIDKKIIDIVEQKLQEVASDSNVTVKNIDVKTDGKLKISFDYISNNELNFSISGISVSGKADAKKTIIGLLPFSGDLKVEINNVFISGSYNYINGFSQVNSISAPIKFDGDLDFGIPILGELFDLFIDDIFLDDFLDSLPADLNEIFNKDQLSITLFSLSDIIPRNQIIYEGKDYGAYILDELNVTNRIDINFSVSIGRSTVVSQQYFEVALGSLVYKRWTKGGKRSCTISDEFGDFDEFCFSY